MYIRLHLLSWTLGSCWGNHGRSRGSHGRVAHGRPRERHAGPQRQQGKRLTLGPRTSIGDQSWNGRLYPRSRSKASSNGDTHAVCPHGMLVQRSPIRKRLFQPLPNEASFLVLGLCLCESAPLPDGLPCFPPASFPHPHTKSKSSK